MTTKKQVPAEAYLIKLVGGSLSFGRLLQSHRISDGISQAELARKMNISRAHLCQIEKGEKAVSPARAAAFAKVLGYSEVLFVKVALQDQLKKAHLPFAITLQVA